MNSHFDDNDKIILKLSGMVKLENDVLFYLDNQPVE